MIVLFGAVAAGVTAASLVLVPLASMSLPHLGHPERALLRTAGWRWPLWVWEGLRLAVAGCALGAGALAGVPYLVAGAAVAPTMVLHWRVGERRAAAARGAVIILQTVHSALRSGMDVAHALRVALERADPILREPFDTALRSFALNGALDVALRAAARDAWDGRLAFALDALALVASEQLPSARAAAMVAAASERMAFEQRLREEVAARTSGIRAQIVLLALLVPALALYLALTMPGLGRTLTSPIGLLVLIPAALVFEVAGIVASRAIVSRVDE